MAEDDLRYFRQHYFSEMVYEVTHQLPRELDKFGQDLVDNPTWTLDTIEKRLNHALMQRVAKIFNELRLQAKTLDDVARPHHLSNAEDVRRVLDMARQLEGYGYMPLAYHCYKAARAEAMALRVEERLRVEIAAHYGRLSNDLGNRQQAVGLLREALELEQGAPQPSPLRIAYRKSNLAAVLLNLRQDREALALLEEARAVYERVAVEDVVLALIYANLFVARLRSRGDVPRDHTDQTSIIDPAELLERSRRLMTHLPQNHPYWRAIQRLSPSSKIN